MQFKARTSGGLPADESGWRSDGVTHWRAPFDIRAIPPRERYRQFGGGQDLVTTVWGIALMKGLLVSLDENRRHVILQCSIFQPYAVYQRLESTAG